MREMGDYCVINLKTGMIVDGGINLTSARETQQYYSRPGPGCSPCRYFKAFDGAGNFIYPREWMEAADSLHDGTGSAELIAVSLGLPIDRVRRIERRHNDNPTIDFVFANIDGKFARVLDDGSLQPII